MEQTITLTDIRDNNTYTVAKLKDGKCWMTQNLRIGSNQNTFELTAETSDIQQNFVLPRGSNTGMCFSVVDNNAMYIDADPAVGGYYTFYTATVGEGGSSKTSGEMNNSICPKGWKIPSFNEYEIMFSKYSIPDLFKTPVNITQNGMCGNGSECYNVNAHPCYAGSNTRIWPSTVYNSTTANWITFSGTTSRAESANWKGFGSGVRCIRRD